jgi:hypothetical protein
MTFEPAMTLSNAFRKAMLPVAALAVALLCGLSETVALGLARRRAARYR